MRTALLPAFLAFGLAWAAPARVLAQPAPPPAPPEAGQPPKQPAITLPVVTRNEGASYPAAALREGFHDVVDVPLLLTIDATGTVTRVDVEKPFGHGFDEAATAAAQRLTFQPATRDGKPVAARLRFVYRFAPPPGVLGGRVLTLAGDRPIAGAAVTVRDAAGGEQSATTGADGAWRLEGLAAGAYHVTVRAPGMEAHEADESVAFGEETSSVDRLAPVQAPSTPPSAVPDAGPEAVAVEEVEVRGTKPPREVTKRTLEEREIERIPGTNGDALRSLLNLPGVARPPPLSGLLIVRGSAPQDSVYSIDGTPVPIVYHFGGLSSVVPTEMLDRIDFYPGNFSAQFGRAMGGVVDVGLTDPKKDRVHMMASLDLIDGRVLAQGPLFDTGWTFAVGGRRSTVDTWLPSIFEATGSGVQVTPVYYDYQAILQRDLSRRSSIRLAFFGSDDKIDVFLPQASAGNPDLAGVIGSHTGFWRAQVLYRNKLGDNTEFRAVGSVGEDYLDFSAGNIFFQLTDWPITSRVELAQKLDRRLTMNVGFDVLFAPYTAQAQLPPPPKAGQPPPGPFSSQPLLNASATSNFYEPAFYTEFEATPWAGGRLVPGMRLDYTRDNHAWDLSPRIVARQDITSEPRTTVKAGVGVFTQPPTPQQNNTVFGMPGLSSNRALHYDLGVERVFTRNIEASLEGFYKQLDDLVQSGLGNTGSGVVYGAETLIRYKPDERFFGWIAYTLSRSLRRTQPGAPLRVFQYDETHVLTVLGSYRLGRGWEIGARYRLTSGYMYTPQTYGFYDENVGTYIPLASYPTFNSRLPLFQSLDIRVDRTWDLGWGKFHAYLDVINVYNQGNVDGLSYDFNSTHSTYANDLPIIPSIGAKLEY
jgi:TonB family protein